MNKLNGLRCYIAGPIEHSGDNDFFNKADLCSFLESLGVKVLDPKKISFEGISEIKNRKELMEENNLEEIRRQAKIVVRKDLRCVDVSDFIIAHLPYKVPTTGTIHEIIEADRQKKPVLLFCEKGAQYLPFWFFGIIPLRYMFGPVQELKEYLVSVNEEKIQDDRWQFVISNLTSEYTKF